MVNLLSHLFMLIFLILRCILAIWFDYMNFFELSFRALKIAKFVIFWKQILVTLIWNVVEIIATDLGTMWHLWTDVFFEVYLWSIDWAFWSVICFWKLFINNNHAWSLLWAHNFIRVHQALILFLFSFEELVYNQPVNINEKQPNQKWCDNLEPLEYTE